MSKLLLFSLCGLAVMTGVARAKATHPVDSPLLRLVPANAQLVSGISDPSRSSSSGGRLLMVTENDNRDLEDCFALIGVDHNITIKEVIEANASSVHGDLSDHLLLIAGHFNDKQILRAATENGATDFEYQGNEVLEVKPFEREVQFMRGVRWMTILRNDVLVFGVPGMVVNALARYESGAPADPIFLQRLGRLPSDVDSWTIAAIPASRLATQMDTRAIPASVAGMLRISDEVELGVQYARLTRIDFCIHTDTSGPSAVLSSTAQPMLAGFARERHLRLQYAIAGDNRIHGRITVPENEFDRWLVALEKDIVRSRDQGTGDR
jgi:hypothetical protein